MTVTPGAKVDKRTQSIKLKSTKLKYDYKYEIQNEGLIAVLRIADINIAGILAYHAVYSSFLECQRVFLLLFRELILP
ncbi:MAG TPA: hypothetical protein DEG76_02385 [Pseudohongiella sp.]|nr:hypothetical protein [Pseudohongiella sp.]HBX36202.1 hypothetical protein [Pseudohongiella sp.]